MKLIFAIVNKDDSGSVSSALTRAGFSVTKLATTGGFLMAGNTTFLVGTDDSRVDEIISIIEKHSKKRTQMVPSSTYGTSTYASFPVEVTVGGELAVSVSEAAGTKCPRCWKHSTKADENGLCPRCAAVAAKLPAF